MHFHLTIYHIINGILKLFSQKFTSYFNQIDISNLTSSIFLLHVPIRKAVFLEILKNTLSKSGVHLYIEYGPIIIFFILLLVVSQNRKTQFFFKRPVYFTWNLLTQNLTFYVDEKSVKV